MALFRWLKHVLWLQVGKQRVRGIHLEKFQSLVSLRLNFYAYLAHSWVIPCCKIDQVPDSSLPAQNWVHGTCSPNMWWLPHWASFSFYPENHFLLIRRKGMWMWCWQQRRKEDRLKDFSCGTKVSREEIFLLRKRKQKFTHPVKPTEMGNMPLKQQQTGWEGFPQSWLENAPVKEGWGRSPCEFWCSAFSWDRKWWLKRYSCHWGSRMVPDSVVGPSDGDSREMIERESLRQAFLKCTFWN